MSIASIAKITKTALPKPLFSAARATYHWTRPAMIGPAHATVFICDDTTDTFIGVNNHFSWLSAGNEINAKIVMRFYDEAGALIATRTERLGYFQSKMLNVREFVRSHGSQAKFGMFSLAVEPVNRWNAAVKRMGVVTGIFYVLHQDTNGSIALLHPNARIGKVAPLENWRSLQVISTQGLRNITLYQLNAGDYRHRASHYLINAATGKIFMERTTEYEGKSTHKIVFDIDGQNAPAQLYLHADSLPSSNAKPLLRRTFECGQFTISHA